MSFKVTYCPARKFIHPDYWKQLFLSPELLMRFSEWVIIRREVFLKRNIIKNTNSWRLKIPWINFWRDKGSKCYIIHIGDGGYWFFRIPLMQSKNKITFSHFLRVREQKWYFCSGLLRITANFWRGTLPNTPHQYRGGGGYKMAPNPLG